MFDTYIARAPRTEYVTREVHEHRAPTDDSIRLLREMEAAADAKRIASFKLDGNAMSGTIEVWQEPAQGFTLFARAVFDINGKRCVCSATSDSAQKLDLMRKLHEQIAKTVADEVIGALPIEDDRW